MSSFTFKKLGIIEKTCSVTAFDLKFQVTRDGRERGLWFCLSDESRDRRAQNLLVAKESFYRGETNEAALLEWDEVKSIYEALGQALKASGHV